MFPSLKKKSIFVRAKKFSVSGINNRRAEENPDLFGNGMDRLC